MPYLLEVRLFSSTSSLTTLALPSYFSAMASTTGASTLQGGHHAAQKSTRTGTGPLSTSVAKFPSRTSPTFPLMARSFQELGSFRLFPNTFGSETDHHSSRGLCRVRDDIRVQGPQPEVRPLVPQPAIFGPERNAIGYLEVDTSTVHERRLRLTLGPRDNPAGVERRIEHQRSRSRQYVGLYLDGRPREGHDER